MAKTIIFERKSDGGVTKSNLNPKHVAAMQASGFGWTDEKIAKEIARWVAAGKTTEVATNWCNAIGKGGLTEDEALDVFVAKLNKSDYSASHIIEESSLPTEMQSTATAEQRYFRDAQVWSSDNVAVDMTKAKAVHLGRIRLARNTELAKQDIEYTKAVEADDASKKSEVSTLKQTLRDIPATFDMSSYDTADKLKAAWPSELPDREELE
jgi:hypothetical protein